MDVIGQMACHKTWWYANSGCHLAKVQTKECHHSHQKSHQCLHCNCQSICWNNPVRDFRTVVCRKGLLSIVQCITKKGLQPFSKFGVDIVLFSTIKYVLRLIRVRHFGQNSVSTRTNANNLATTNWTCQNIPENLSRQCMMIHGITCKGGRHDV
jgi:hypothetical protein